MTPPSSPMTFGVPSGSSEPDHLCLAGYSVLIKHEQWSQSREGNLWVVVKVKSCVCLAPNWMHNEEWPFQRKVWSLWINSMKIQLYSALPVTLPDIDKHCHNIWKQWKRLHMANWLFIDDSQLIMIYSCRNDFWSWKLSFFYSLRRTVSQGCSFTSRKKGLKLKCNIFV